MIKPIVGLTLIDSQVLKLVGERTIEVDSLFINIEQLGENAQLLSISEENLYDAIAMLARKRYIEVVEPWTLGGGIVSLTFKGFKNYAQAYLPTYSSVIESVVYQIATGNLDHKEIASTLQVKQVLVDHIINILDQKGGLKAASHVGGMSIYDISPRLQQMSQKELLQWFTS